MHTITLAHWHDGRAPGTELEVDDVELAALQRDGRVAAVREESGEQPEADATPEAPADAEPQPADAGPQPAGGPEATEPQPAPGPAEAPETAEAPAEAEAATEAEEPARASRKRR